jgi:hypothetical protein
MTQALLRDIKLGLKLLPTANTLAYLTKESALYNIFKRILCHTGKKYFEMTNTLAYPTKKISYIASILTVLSRFSGNKFKS